MISSPHLIFIILSGPRIIEQWQPFVFSACVFNSGQTSVRTAPQAQTHYSHFHGATSAMRARKELSLFWISVKKPEREIK
jgi:hypothetical protein